MKKLILFVMTLLSTSIPIYTNNNFNNNKNDTQDKIQYAQIVNSTNLYQKLDDEYVELTTLPTTYFVSILGQEEVGGFLPVSYLDLDGYIKSSDIDIVDYEPVTKDTVGEININNPDINSVNLRYVPDHNDADNIIDQVSRDNQGLCYYGSVKGSNFNGTDIWYYVRTIKNGQAVRGYVFGGNMTATPIKDNVVVKVPNPDSEDNISKTPSPLSDTTLYIIIGALCIPVVLLMIFSFKKKTNNIKSTVNTPINNVE
ncbi:MAG: hypothetical protein FWF56_01680 [Firmicutes bacterium]|nr:hypothetical protein [Bacillota bacterium]